MARIIDDKIVKTFVLYIGGCQDSCTSGLTRDVTGQMSRVLSIVIVMTVDSMGCQDISPLQFVSLLTGLAYSITPQTSQHNKKITRLSTNYKPPLCKRMTGLIFLRLCDRIQLPD